MTPEQRDHRRRTVGSWVQAVFATTGTVFMAAVVVQGAAQMDIVWIAIAVSLACASWLGVLAWRRGRWGWAALLAWTAPLTNLWLWSATIIPLAYAVIATVLVVKLALDGRAHRARESL